LSRIGTGPPPHRPPQSGRARCAIIAAKNRAASPPITTRWSKVSDSGSTRRSTAGTTSTCALSHPAGHRAAHLAQRFGGRGLGQQLGHALDVPGDDRAALAARGDGAGIDLEAAGERADRECRLDPRRTTAPRASGLGNLRRLVGQAARDRAAVCGLGTVEGGEGRTDLDRHAGLGYRPPAPETIIPLQPSPSMH